MNAMPSDYVTKTEFNDFKTEMLDFKAEMTEFKTEMCVFRDEMREFKAEMLDFKAEMVEFKGAVYVQYEEQKNDYIRHLGAVEERLRHEIRVVGEGLRMFIEESARRWDEHQREHSILNMRVARLEAKLL